MWLMHAETRGCPSVNRGLLRAVIRYGAAHRRGVLPRDAFVITATGPDAPAIWAEETFG